MYSIEDYNGDGGNQNFNIPFPYLLASDIHVFVGGVEVDQGTLEFTSSSVVRLPSAPPVGTGNVRVQRLTDVSALVTTFQTGLFDTTNINKVLTQLLYLGQEAYDLGVLNDAEVSDLLDDISAVASAAAASASTASIQAADAAASQVAALGSQTAAAASAAAAAAAAASIDPSLVLLKAGNLAGLADVPTSRGNLGLGALAVKSTVAETDITLADNATNNASTANHGFLKKLSNVAGEFMNGIGNWAAITDAILSFTDVATNNASTAAHGFLKKLSNTATEFMNGQGNWAAVKEADLAFTDVTNNNATTTLHGFLKKLSNTATNFMNGQGNWADVKDSDLAFTDIATNDSSTSKHGFLKKLSNTAAQFMNGQGNWAEPDKAGTRIRFYFIASDGASWSKPTAANFIGVTVIAVGPGGGSGGSNTTNARIGAGGGAGAWSMKTILAASLGSTEALAIGTGGTAGTTTTGGAAGNKATAFGAHLSAGAGAGGVVGTAADAQAAGGAATGGDVNMDGMPGSFPGLNTDTFRGHGGACGSAAINGSRTASIAMYRLGQMTSGLWFAGNGAISRSESSAVEGAGVAGGFPGGGASGGMRVATAAQAGAAGANGLLIVMEHYGA